jgi:hypothetical protein
MTVGVTEYGVRECIVAPPVCHCDDCMDRVSWDLLLPLKSMKEHFFSVGLVQRIIIGFTAMSKHFNGTPYLT